MRRSIINTKAKLRVCGGCEWIFNNDTDFPKCCPKCGFSSYGAKSVYGSKAYKYKISQEPYVTKKVNNYRYRLTKYIKVNE